MKRQLILAGAFLLLAGCDQKLPGAKPDAVRITLSPDVVSSQDGTMRITATALEANTPLRDFTMKIAIDYTDRNGVPRLVAGTSGLTTRSGSLEFVAQGLSWEGAGTVTAQAFDRKGTPILDRDGAPVESTATFSVLDLSPPTVTIDPPTLDLKVGPSLPFDVPIHVTDEIGVSQVYVQLTGEMNSQGSRIVASGTTDGTVTFDFTVPNGALPGPTITIYAMAADLSGNLSAATPITLTVDPNLAIGVLPGFAGMLLSDGSQSFLDQPTAIALSPKDGMLYVADNSSGAPCNQGCIRQVDPANGTPAAAAVVSGQQSITGLSFDATGDHLYYSFNTGGTGSLVQLTYAMGTGYGSPVTCNVAANQNPADPWHSVFDATLGLLVADQQDQVVKRQAACNQADPVNFAGGGMLNQPFGVAAEPGGTGFYVSEVNNDRIYRFDNTGATTVFELAGMNQPEGIEWLAGGASAFADSLMVANNNSRKITSTRGNYTPRDAVFLRNDPVDLAIDNGTMYILTQPSQNNRGRIFAVTGF